jgi:hypothetical protein
MLAILAFSPPDYYRKNLLPNDLKFLREPIT